MDESLLPKHDTVSIHQNKMVIIRVCQICLIYRVIWLSEPNQIHSINHTNGVRRGQFMVSILRPVLLLSWACRAVKIPCAHRVFFVAGLTSGNSYSEFRSRMQSSVP